MYIILDTRDDRLGANLLTYICYIIYAHKKKLIVKFMNNSKKEYSYYHSVFVKILFNYIDFQNKELYNNNNIKDDTPISYTEFPDAPKAGDLMPLLAGKNLYNIECDLLSYFYKNIHCNIRDDILNINKTLYNIPFDINKTILVHLRLDDTQKHKWPDYDGRICSHHYKLRMEKNLPLYHFLPNACNECCEGYNGAANMQSPLSKQKIINIIEEAKKDFPHHKIIFLTSPMSDTSFLDDLNYPIIKSEDESLDLYYLSICRVTILSRSTYALSSLFFSLPTEIGNHSLTLEEKTYIPLWGHMTCLGLDTKYDKTEKRRFSYFY